jgi:hypothetical protein
LGSRGLESLRGRTFTPFSFLLFRISLSVIGTSFSLESGAQSVDQCILFKRKAARVDSELVEPQYHVLVYSSTLHFVYKACLNEHTMLHWLVSRDAAIWAGVQSLYVVDD